MGGIPEFCKLRWGRLARSFPAQLPSTAPTVAPDLASRHAALPPPGMQSLTLPPATPLRRLQRPAGVWRGQRGAEGGARRHDPGPVGHRQPAGGRRVRPAGLLGWPRRQHPPSKHPGHVLTPTLCLLSFFLALQVGGEFLARFYKGSRLVLIPNPSWANHRNIFERCGLEVQTYRCVGWWGCGGLRQGGHKAGPARLFFFLDGSAGQQVGAAAFNSTLGLCCWRGLVAGTSSRRRAAWTMRWVLWVVLGSWCQQGCRATCCEAAAAHAVD